MELIWGGVEVLEAILYYITPNATMNDQSQMQKARWRVLFMKICKNLKILKPEILTCLLALFNLGSLCGFKCSATFFLSVCLLVRAELTVVTFFFSVLKLFSFSSIFERSSIPGKHKVPLSVSSQRRSSVVIVCLLPRPTKKYSRNWGRH